MKKICSLILALALILAGSCSLGEDSSAAPDVDSSSNAGDYEVDLTFDGTFWESGSLRLLSVFQDGYYKVVVTGGETEMVYLCELKDTVVNEKSLAVLTGIGTGDPDLTESQADHGISSFVYDWETAALTWKRSDGSETVFTRIVNDLDATVWYFDGKTLSIVWKGDLNYQINIEGKKFTSWSYNVVLDEETDTLEGTGQKVSYSDTVYTDSKATFTFRNNRSELVWIDEKEATADFGQVFEAVNLSFMNSMWQQADQTCSAAVQWTDGFYDFHVFSGDAEHAYLCTYDRASGTFTSVDPSLIDFDSFSLYLEKSLYTAAGSFVQQDDTHLIWHDHSGLAGENGVLMERII